MMQTNQLSNITDSTVTGRSRFCLEALTGGAPPLANSLCLPKEHVTGSELSCVARLVRQNILYYFVHDSVHSHIDPS